MGNTDSWCEPYLVAADAMGAARDVEAAVRNELPQLLGRGFSSTCNMLADHFEAGRVLDRMCRSAVETVLAECDCKIARGTETRWTSYESGWVAGSPVFTPELSEIRSPEAEQLFQIRKRLQRVKDLADRTMDLLAADAAIRNIRT